MQRRTLLSLVIAAAALPAVAATIADQHFDDRIRLADRDLVLNGVGVRAVAWFTGYAAGLYLVQRARDAAAVTALPGPKRLALKMLAEVEPQEWIKAFGKGMRRNLAPAVHAAMADRMATFDANIRKLGTVKPGDTVNIDFVPGTGTLITLNGGARGEAVPGDDFYAAVLHIFVGDDPVDKKLKAGLLGAT